MERNKEPEKWREGIDPFALPLKNIQIQKILGYPHAANQVFYLRGLEDGKEGYYYLKYASHIDANLQNEIAILQQLHVPWIPQVVEYDTSYQYEVTRQIDGRRLSVILAESDSGNNLDYLYTYGRTLAQLHQTEGFFPAAPHRRFHDIPDPGYCQEIGMEAVYSWLLTHQPKQINCCFVHGDFHYANLLWKGGEISGILDFELAGMGNREFDIAWALILRPGQGFLKTEAEQQTFLAGYQSLGHCDRNLVHYYMVLIYTRFLKFGDPLYEEYVRQWLQAAII